MPTQLLTIARNAFVEAVRQPIFFFLIVLCGVLLIFSTWGAGFAMGYSSSAEVSGDDKLLLEIGMGTVLVCGMLLAAFLATAVISREIENKTALTVVSKPVPRAVVVVGKYLGIAAALLFAVATMVLFLLLAIRHGVMSTAADHVDQPVVVFALAATLLSVAVAVWTNYFYGWSFTQTAALLLLPTFLIAYAIVLFVDEEWKLQPLTETVVFHNAQEMSLEDYQIFVHEGKAPPVEQARTRTTYPTLRPQITMASAAVLMAILVLSSIATALSTRLSQVMTIVVSAGIFLFGLLSNHFLGRHAFENEPVAFVRRAVSVDPADTSFTRLGAEYELTLDGPARTSLDPGTSIYYGASASGFDLVVPPFAPFAGDPADPLDADLPGAVIVTDNDGRRITIKQSGGRALPIRRPPEEGDALFIRPTSTNSPALAAWAVVPNMQFFWLVDAVSQNHRVPAGHLGLIAGYSVLQIAAFLALGVALFQNRDMG